MEFFVMSKRSENRTKFFALLNSFGQPTITFNELKTLCEENGLSHPYWYTNDDANKVKRGVYRVQTDTLPTNQIALAAKVLPMTKPVETSGNHISNVSTQIAETNLVPEEYPNYVPFGIFSDVLAVVKSNKFFPVFITGHSGNGKTMSVEQACAKAKRKFIIVSMTPETDESDLLGNYVLINGQMEWRDGPVTTAARLGAVLCIDEIDYGAQNLSTLQRVLEGKPFMLKKKGEMIVPAPGFTVFATANTKGKGSDDGRYMFTNVLNEAFLERFPNTYEQEWPPVSVEKKIITKEFDSIGVDYNPKYIESLVTWADVIRKTFSDNGCDEVISTRRLVHIVRTFGIYGDIMKSIQMCLNRFDENTKASFLDLYTKVTSDEVNESTTQSVTLPNQPDEVPF
jgi:hypothetical protein